MDRDSGTNTMLLLIVGVASVGCVIVGMIGCLFLAAMLFGINPLGPTVYNLF